ncbi:unnamed protein product [Nesidiocoris tenuis]|uniref:Ig-like domain-containing protein n=1 Tax=Nesidiocoris tenuis TaxID=355587 RepID=A0A6H5GQ61_9HEMI|nr:unnamed protein product [Nesidiocoris tenuis]
MEHKSSHLLHQVDHLLSPEYHRKDTSWIRGSNSLCSARFIHTEKITRKSMNDHDIHRHDHVCGFQVPHLLQRIAGCVERYGKGRRALLVCGHPWRKHRSATTFFRQPSPSIHPADVVEDEGGDVTFHCEFEGSPLYSMVQWIKDGIPVRGPRHMVENTSTGSLRINSVLPSDQGAYVCQVLTMPYQPALSKPALLTVIEKLKFVPRPMNTNLELDAVRKVHCRAQGAAPPVIKWIKVGGSRAIHDTFNQLENGSLLIDYVQASDEGKYGCTAGNSGGLKRYEVTLIVRGTESYRVSDGNDVNSTLGGGMMSKTVAVTLGAAVAYMILVIGLMAYCRCRNKKNKSPPSDVQDPVCEYDQIQKR